MDTTIIYHAYRISDNYIFPCPDGLAAAWVALKKFPGSKTIPCAYPSYDTPFDHIPYMVNKQVVVVDFSVHPLVIDAWKKNGCDVTIIDHHQTAIEFLSSIRSQLKGILDCRKCGAVLTWEYYFPDKPIPAFLYLVQDSDCGKLWELPQEEYWDSDASYFHKYSSMMGRSYSFYDQIENLSNEELVKIAREHVGDFLVKKRKSCERKMPSFVRGKLDNYTVGYVYLNSGSISSDLAKMYLDLNPDVDLAFINVKDNKVSLRSSVGKNINVAAIASDFGGGGHKNAAGFTLTQPVENFVSF